MQKIRLTGVILGRITYLYYAKWLLVTDIRKTSNGYGILHSLIKGILKGSANTEA
ncbi:hypothetical protein [Bacillus thuringiensis]|uniref:hypothetical protein n=1 Tax=Bacillus thuringiensis TaxID=1428 RepID=UPI001C54CFFD|nr:hypothetical protein [Bacillus thuringiensis]